MSGVTEITRLCCLVFTDLAGSTALKTELGDEAAGLLISRHRAHVRRLIGETGGREVDSAGDGFFLTFEVPSRAVAFALRLQQIHASDSDLPGVRVGIHLGEVSERTAPAGSSKPALVEGLAVDVAARIGSIALPGQVLMSSSVFDAVRQRSRFEELGEEVYWVAHGPYLFKGVAEPLEIGEAGIGRTSSLPPPSSSEKAWRLAKTGNLPSLLPEFVGRASELRTLQESISSSRLVTVVGPAGCGKTRTAIQAATAVGDGYRGGVWLVELAAETDGRAVPGAVARALSVAPEPGVSLIDALIDALRYRPTLLLLDNCEHVIESASELAESLLRDCPELRVLATSREPLRARTERLFPLEPMLTESADGGVPDAVALFTSRARSEGATVDQLEQEREAIEALCSSLDGLPLAIELAATRVRSISASQLAGHMGERFRVLKAPRRPAEARHQTLRTAIDWSYELLDDSQRTLFDRLSLFSGAFELADAVAVVSDGEMDELDLLDGLSALVDVSMVVAVSGSSPGYRLLETLRAYASDRLAASPEVAALKRRHAEHFAAKAEAARHEIVGPRHVSVVDSLVAQVAEYRSAVSWAIEADDIDLAVRLTAAFCGASYFRIGYEALDWLGSEPANAARAGRPMSVELLGLLARRAVFGGEAERGRELAERAIALDPGPESMQARAQMALIVSDQEQAIDWAKSVIEVAEPAGDSLGILIGWLILGPRLTRIGRVDEAVDVGRSLLDLAEQRDSEHARGWGHHVLGVALRRRDPTAAEQHLDTAMRLGRAEKNRYLQSNAILMQLDMHLASDSSGPAAAMAHKTLVELTETGDSVFFTRGVLGQIALFLAAQNRAEACVLDGFLRRYRASGAATRPNRAHERAMKPLLEKLGEKETESLRARGGGLGADGVIEVAIRALKEIETEDTG